MSAKWKTREQMEEGERTALAPVAQKSGESRGRQYSEPSHAYRTEFQRDRAASFIRARSAAWNTKRRFFSTAPVTICERA
jgi:hypothetical protein